MLQKYFVKNFLSSILNLFSNKLYQTFLSILSATLLSISYKQHKVVSSGVKYSEDASSCWTWHFNSIKLFPLSRRQEKKLEQFHSLQANIKVHICVFLALNSISKKPEWEFFFYKIIFSRNSLLSTDYGAFLRQ